MGKRRLPLRAQACEEKSGQKRSRRDEAEDDSASGSEDEEGKGDIRLDDVVEHDSMQMTFEFNDMREVYSEGVTTLLRWFLPSHEAYELACVICNQGEVGTTINTEEGDDTFAFATLLPFTESKDTGIVAKVIGEVKSAVAGSTSDSGVALNEHFSLSDLKKTLLMLHTRFSNLPLELIAPLFRNVVHDLEWVQSSENNSAVTVTTVAQFIGVEQLLLICPCSFVEGAAIKIPTGGCIDICGSSSVLFDNFEDETFFEECTAAVMYQAKGLKKTVAAVLFPVSKLTKCTQTLHEMLPQQGATRSIRSAGAEEGLKHEDNRPSDPGNDCDRKLDRGDEGLHDRMAEYSSKKEGIAGNSNNDNLEEERDDDEDRKVTSEAHFYRQNCMHVAGADTVNGVKEHDEQEGVLLVTTFAVYVPDTEKAAASGDRRVTSGSIEKEGVKKGEKNSANRRHRKHTIRVCHEVLTSIARVGLQVWRGAFLLADFIIHCRHSIQSKTIFEFGCGTGILGSILDLCGHTGGAFLTDYSDEIVALAARNIDERSRSAVQQEFRKEASSGIKARVLDWASGDNPRVSLPLHQSFLKNPTRVWTEEDVSRLSTEGSNVLFLAADVIYDDDLTRALFLKASQIMKPGECMWLALEKRYNFSMADNALVANGYRLFQEHVHARPDDENNEERLSFSDYYVYDSPFYTGKVVFKGSKMPINFPQRVFDYDRIQDLELWQIELQLCEDHQQAQSTR